MKIKALFLERKSKWSMWFFVLLIVFAVGIPFVPGIDPNSFDPNLIGDPLPPSFQHIFGTDDLGRDLFVRIVFGSRVSLMVGVVSVGISMVVGIIIGLLAGYLGGWMDQVLMRLVDVFMAIPSLFLILIIQDIAGSDSVLLLLPFHDEFVFQNPNYISLLWIFQE